MGNLCLRVRLPAPASQGLGGGRSDREIELSLFFTRACRPFRSFMPWTRELLPMNAIYSNSYFRSLFGAFSRNRYPLSRGAFRKRTSKDMRFTPQRSASAASSTGRTGGVRSSLGSQAPFGASRSRVSRERRRRSTRRLLLTSRHFTFGGFLPFEGESLSS